MAYVGNSEWSNTLMYDVCRCCDIVKWNYGNIRI